MGQKVNPTGFRLGIIYDWKSRWFATKEYGDFLQKDIQIRKFIAGKLKRAGVSKVEIERSRERVKVDIFTARPGIVIGKRGAEVDILRSELEKITGDKVQINIQEIKQAELDANLVAQSIAEQLEARVSFRRAMKRAVTSALKSGAKGVRVNCAGRLGGSEMARTEWYREGRVPLHTLRADIEYGFAVASTIFGVIGVKVWIYKGDILKQPKLIIEIPEIDLEDEAIKEAAPIRQIPLVETKIEPKAEAKVVAEEEVKTETKVVAKEEVKVEEEEKAKVAAKVKVEVEEEVKPKAKVKVKAETPKTQEPAKIEKPAAKAKKVEATDAKAEAKPAVKKPKATKKETTGEAKE